MLDILLTRSGDININDWGDITLTESVRQAVRIRLLWFFNEWRFAPDKGVPYFEEVFIKNPNQARMRRIVRDQALSVRDVRDVTDIQINTNTNTRVSSISFSIHVEGDIFREEVQIPWQNTD